MSRRSSGIHSEGRRPVPATITGSGEPSSVATASTSAQESRKLTSPRFGSGLGTLRARRRGQAREPRGRQLRASGRARLGIGERSGIATSMSSQRPEDETSRPPSSEIPGKREGRLRDEITGAGEIAAGKPKRPSVQKARGGSSGAARRLLLLHREQLTFTAGPTRG